MNMEDCYDDERKKALMGILEQMSQLVEKGYGDSESKATEAMDAMTEEGIDEAAEEGEEIANETEPEPGSVRDDFAQLLGAKKPKRREGVAMVFAQNKGMSGGAKKKKFGRG